MLSIYERPQGGQGGHLPPPLEFEKMTSYADVLRNTLKFSLASSALAIDTLYFSLKWHKKAKTIVCAFGAPKNGQFFARRAKNMSTFLSVRLVVLPPPPLKKISAGAQCPCFNDQHFVRYGSLKFENKKCSDEQFGAKEIPWNTLQSEQLRPCHRLPDLPLAAWRRKMFKYVHHNSQSKFKKKLLLSRHSQDSCRRIHKKCPSLT